MIYNLEKLTNDNTDYLATINFKIHVYKSNKKSKRHLNHFVQHVITIVIILFLINLKHQVR